MRFEIHLCSKDASGAYLAHVFGSVLGKLQRLTQQAWDESGWSLRLRVWGPGSTQGPPYFLRRWRTAVQRPLRAEVERPFTLEEAGPTEARVRPECADGAAGDAIGGAHHGAFSRT